MYKYLTIALLLAVSSPLPFVSAQEKGKPPAAEHKTAEASGEGSQANQPKQETTQLRLQILITEFDGDKKISNLPYSLLLKSEYPHGEKSSIRMGLRVPIAVGSYTASTGTPNTQFTYVDVGTNIDGSASPLPDGKFSLYLTIERSSVYSSVASQKSSIAAGTEIVTTQPVIQQFKSYFDVLLKDGQSMQSTVATDPVSGRVTKVEITLNVVK